MTQAVVMRRPLPLKRTTPTAIAATGIRKVSFTEAASPAAIPASTSGPLSSSGASRSGVSWTAAPAVGRSSLVAVDQEGREGDQEGEPHDVVARPRRAAVSIITPESRTSAEATSVAGPTL